MERALLNGRVHERMFSELFLHLSLLLGFPTMLEGLATLRKIAGKSRTVQERVQSAQLVARRGKKVLRRIYGKTFDRLLINLKFLHDIVPAVIVRDVYGRIVARPGMSLQEREIVNVVVLSIQRLDQQLYSHLRGALRIGVSGKTLRSAILTGARIANTDATSALKLLTTLSGT